MSVDREARKLKVSNTYAHTLLWHLIDGMGGAVTIPEPGDSTLPASKYVMFWERENGDVELIANDENPVAPKE